MTQEERRQYAREYRAEGFGAVNDRAYYARHREIMCEKARLRYAAKKAGKLSQECTGVANSLVRVAEKL